METERPGPFPSTPTCMHTFLSMLCNKRLDSYLKKHIISLMLNFFRNYHLKIQIAHACFRKPQMSWNLIFCIFKVFTMKIASSLIFTALFCMWEYVYASLLYTVDYLSLLTYSFDAACTAGPYFTVCLKIYDSKCVSRSVLHLILLQKCSKEIVTQYLSMHDMHQHCFF